jgi:hypothetical protein
MDAQNSKIKHSHWLYFSLFAATLVLCIAPLSIAFGQSERRSETAASEDVMVQRDASTYYAQKYRVDLNEAQRRLTIQDRAAGIEDDIAKVLGDQYSGIWYDHADGGKLKIGMTPAAMKRADEVRRIATNYGVAADMDLVRVRFTLAELEQKQNFARKSIADLVDAGLARTSYNTKANEVVVRAIAKLPRGNEARLKRLTKIAGVTVRRVDQPTLRGKADACNVTFCDPPFRGGRQIQSNSAGCTVAFIAHGLVPATQNWAITAGHCIFFGGTTWKAQDESNNWSVLGVTAFFNFSGASGRDAGIVSISANTSWNPPAPLPAVVVKSSAITTYNPNYAITATSFSSIGQILCRTGATTGTECGEVSDLGADESPDWPDGKNHPLHHMGNIDVCGAQGGDSGGPYYKTHRAFGIHSGHAEGTFTCYEFYQGVRAAGNALNVTVNVAP